MEEELVIAHMRNSTLSSTSSTTTALGWAREGQTFINNCGLGVNCPHHPSTRPLLSWLPVGDQAAVGNRQLMRSGRDGNSGGTEWMREQLYAEWSGRYIDRVPSKGGQLGVNEGGGRKGGRKGVGGLKFLALRVIRAHSNPQELPNVVLLVQYYCTHWGEGCCCVGAGKLELLQTHSPLSTRFGHGSRCSRTALPAQAPPARPVHDASELCRRVGRSDTIESNTSAIQLLLQIRAIPATLPFRAELPPISG